MTILDSFQQFAHNTFVYGGAFLLVLSILVFIHEFGHYYVARLCGVKIDSFSIGFGRELFGYTDKEGCRWKFSLIPLGGYVKMFGDTDPASAGHSDQVQDGQQVRLHTDSERKVAFYAQPVGKRALIVFAGPAINFLFAILVMWGLYVFYGQPSTPPTVAAIVQGSAAEKAGFMPHDVILSIDGKQIRRFQEVSRTIMLGLDRERTFEVLRDGKEVIVKATPERLTEEDRFGFSSSRGFLGVVSPGNGLDLARVKDIDGVAVENVDQARELALKNMGNRMVVSQAVGEKVDRYIVKPLAENNEALKTPDDVGYSSLVVAQNDDDVFYQLPPLEGLMVAINETKNITVDTLKAIWQMISGTRSAAELGGLIRIGAIAGDMAKSGIVALIMFTALLSINLGLINLFPIPMLDGGHLVFYAAESLRGAPISEQIQEYAFRMGMAVLVTLMVFANLNDLVQVFL